MKALPLLFILLFHLSYCVNSNAQQSDTSTIVLPDSNDKVVPPPPPPPPPPPKEREIFRVVKDMPHFPGCEGKGNKEEVRKCADEKLAEFVYKNLVYPSEAKANQIEGMCVVQFTIEPDGSVTDVALVHDIGYGCGEAAVDVFERMKEEGVKWIPPCCSRRPVRIRLTYPVKFKLHH